MNYPILITILIFLLCFGRFIWIITHERRSLRAGVSLVITLFSFLFLGVVILVNIADLDPHYKDWILPLFVIALFAVMAGTIIFLSAWGFPLSSSYSYILLWDELVMIAG